MNIKLQTNNFNSQYNNYSYNRNKIRNSKPSFTAAYSAIPQKSSFLSPLKRAFDSFTTNLSKYYTDKLYTSWIAKQLVKRTEKLDSVVDIMSILGSVVISGMYMTQTLRNKQLDEDRRQTLAINQGLTFGVSTLGSILIDKSLDNWWEKKTVNYAQKRSGDYTIGEQINKINKERIKAAEEKIGKVFKDFTKKEKKGVKLMNTLSYVEDKLDNEALEVKLKGMGVLKKLIIFGTVYRFISPVAVTPLANAIGNKLIERKQKNNDQ